MLEPFPEVDALLAYRSSVERQPMLSEADEALVALEGEALSVQILRILLRMSGARASVRDSVMPFPDESDALDAPGDLAALGQIEKDDEADYHLPAEYLLWTLQPPPYFPWHVRPFLLHAGASRMVSSDNGDNYTD